MDKQTFHSGPFNAAQGRKVGNTLYLSAQLGRDASRKAGADITEQTRLAYENVKSVLAEFGATMDDIVDEILFVTDVDELMSNAAMVFGVRTEAYGGTPEAAQSVVGINALAMPDLKISIKCVAVVE